MRQHADKAAAQNKGLVLVMMRWVLVGLGGLLLLVGLVWIGQGTGFFPYPAESFMIDQRPWAWRGGAVAVAGLVFLLFSRRMRRV